VNSICGTLEISLGCACITHLAVAKSKVVYGHVMTHELHKELMCGLKAWV
jgi:hypothetical protein